MNLEDTVLSVSRKKKHIVHGGRALNKLLPENLYRPTEDWDLFSRKPKASAFNMQAELDKEICGGRDCFHDVEYPLAGSSEKVYRVVEKATGKFVVDFIRTPFGTKYQTVGGVRYETLKSAKRKLEKILRDQSAQHRWEKTAVDLRRIEAFEGGLHHKEFLPESMPSTLAVLIKGSQGVLD